jgi:plastocyanin
MGSTRPRIVFTCLLLAVTAALMAGCGGDSDQTSSAPAKAEGGAAVAIHDYTYKPANITVPRGTTVVITNRDSTPHTVTSKESGDFESGSIGTGKSGRITLQKSGTFAYYCVFHPFMKGTITVE